MKWNRFGCKVTGIWARRRGKGDKRQRTRVPLIVEWKSRCLTARKRAIWRSNRGVIVYMMRAMDDGIRCPIRFRIQCPRRGGVPLLLIPQRPIIWGDRTVDRKSRGFHRLNSRERRTIYLFMTTNLCFLFRFLVICNVNLCESKLICSVIDGR